MRAHTHRHSHMYLVPNYIVIYIYRDTRRNVPTRKRAQYKIII